MTEIVMDIIPIGILHIKILIPFGHRMNLRDMGNRMDAVNYFAGLVHQDESVIAYLRPLRSNAMQIPLFGKELTSHSIGRDDDFCLLVLLQKIS